jgi:hypothetical protein
VYYEIRMRTFINIFGWYGTIAIVFAYTMVSFSVLEPMNIWYQLLNATGALGIVAVSFNKKTYQPGVLNCIWAIIALIAIARISL